MRLRSLGRLRDNRRMTDAAHNQHSETRRSEPAKKSGQNIPKNRCRTTIAEPIGETRAGLPFIGDQVVCLSHDQAARIP